MLQREDIKPFFDYELTMIVPTSLFKDSFMWKPVKSQLAQFLTLYMQSLAFDGQGTFHGIAVFLFLFWLI